MITITFYGHSCFKVQNEMLTFIFDPYQNESVPGLTLPLPIVCNAVFCSHEHRDHNASELITIDHPYDFHVEKITVPHDDCDGEKRGLNDIHIVTIDNKKIVHLGDIGRMLKEDEISSLRDIDVLMCPVGGYYTIDASIANDIIHALQPKCTILMHYRNANIGYDEIASIDDVIKVIRDVKQLHDNTITIEDINELPSIITLDPLQ